MDVLFWQIAVVITVALARRLFGVVAGLTVAIAWTLWTFTQINHAPLAILQPVVAWTTFYFTHKYKKTSERNAALEEAVKRSINSRDISGEKKEEILGRLKHNPETFSLIAGKEHLTALRAAFEQAGSTICILSGWIGRPLLDRDLQTEISKAINRGVNIHIGYGWQSDGRHIFSTPAQKAKKYLLSLMKHTPIQVHVGEFGTHEKLIVIDDRRVIYGSNNWLSNYTFSNAERSVAISDQDLATSERERAIAMVSRNHL
jgi:phosphatidylserine/phosphatidylglycerophosphate/cardiolipin synthase-like enzyme